MSPQNGKDVCQLAKLPETFLKNFKTSKLPKHRLATLHPEVVMYCGALG